MHRVCVEPIARRFRCNIVVRSSRVFVFVFLGEARNGMLQEQEVHNTMEHEGHDTNMQFWPHGSHRVGLEDKNTQNEATAWYEQVLRAPISVHIGE